MDIFNLIGSLFGYVLWFCFMLVHDYGIAIVLFTLFLKIIFFPRRLNSKSLWRQTPALLQSSVSCKKIWQ